MKRNFFRIPKILSLFPVVLIVGSCGANLENVEKFGLTSAIIQESSTNMVKDIYQSCLRQAKYKIPNNENNQDNFIRSLRILEAKDPNLEQEEKKCQENKYQDAVRDINLANSVLIDYMVALGKLASDDTVSFENNLAKLEFSLANLNTTLNITLASIPSIASDSPPIFKEEEIQAGLTIARFVFNQLTTQFRQENLQEAILCSNEAIQVYIPGLMSITQDFYVEGILESEELENYQYYSNFVQYTLPEEEFANASKKEQTAQVLALYTFKQEYLNAVNNIEQKKEAANAYQEILQATANTHQELFNEFNQSAMNRQEIEVFCQEYFAKDADESSPQISSLTSQQLKRVKQIVMEYNKEIKPLVNQLDRAF
jgi:hypothetical protein